MRTYGLDPDLRKTAVNITWQPNLVTFFMKHGASWNCLLWLDMYKGKPLWVAVYALHFAVVDDYEG